LYNNFIIVKGINEPLSLIIILPSRAQARIPILFVICNF